MVDLMKAEKSSSVIQEELKKRIIQYYEEAGLDYSAWSSSFNMHFGFGSIWQIFNRERMLHRMSEEVFKRLNITNDSVQVADFGCGVGATMRYGAKIFERITFSGLTIVPWQIQKGNEINLEEGVDSRIRFYLEDYHASSLSNSSFDAVYAIESACHSPKMLQDQLFSEMYRVLKPGSRLVIADGFIKKSESDLCKTTKYFYKNVCECWALPGMININELKDKLENIGFKNIRIEDISWRVAPSVIHVPYVILKFLLRKFLKGNTLGPQSIKNLKGAFQTLLLGLARKQFGYYLVTCEK